LKITRDGKICSTTMEKLTTAPATDKSVARPVAPSAPYAGKMRARARAAFASRSYSRGRGR
jgi:hypothetical protein